MLIVHLIGTPPLAVPEHAEEYVVLYPEIDDPETLYLPGCSVTEVPEDEPENDFGDGLLPETVMVKSEGFLVPPLVLSTLAITLKNVVDPGGGRVYLLETVHLIRPPLAVPEQAEEYVVVYPEIEELETLYFPANSVTDVPCDEPANEAGFGLLPDTLMVKSEGFLVPPLVLSTLVITLKNVLDPGGGLYLLEIVHLIRPPLAEPEQAEE